MCLLHARKKYHKRKKTFFVIFRKLWIWNQIRYHNGCVWWRQQSCHGYTQWTQLPRQPPRYFINYAQHKTSRKFSNFPFLPHICFQTKSTEKFIFVFDKCKIDIKINKLQYNSVAVLARMYSKQASGGSRGPRGPGPLDPQSWGHRLFWGPNYMFWHINKTKHF